MTHWHVTSETQGPQAVFLTNAEARRWMQWAGAVYGVLVLRRCDEPFHPGGLCLAAVRNLGMLKEEQ